MIPMLPPLRLTGGLCLRDGRLQQRSIALADGRFTTGPYPAVDLRGYYILPGIVDLHAEGDAADSPQQRDRAAAERGVTTRRVAVPWAWDSAERTPDAARAVVAAHAAARSGFVTDLQVHLFCEVLLTPEQDALLALVRSYDVAQVIFTNHAAQLDQMRNADPAGFLRWAWRRGVTADALSTALDAVQGNTGAVPRHLCNLAERFDALGVLYGSDGDATAEQREHHSMIGARLCLNPGTARVAAAARAVGDPVLVGADPATAATGDGTGPRATALIHAGLCDALVSGQNPDALVPLIFRLVDQGLLPLDRAWRLVSDMPARIARMPDRGTIMPGKRADVTIVNAETRAVEATIAAGRLAHVAGDCAARFHGLTDRTRMAAE